ncbi:unnamed protein product [Paramecium primaurelia]|uniref:Transmembrane protein n=1 Tax=Paramecium primaurelia TaxID=5886 RepID=A0A8S1L596_PARPR|nr:unnamed protein product [Paramecium primaurelia]
MTLLIPLLILIFGFSCQYIVDLSQDYQTYTQQLNLQLEDLVTNKFFTYGLWNKYLPLGQISQIGQMGVFGSNCYHLHNAADSLTLKVDLIYFDCLDVDQMKITKVIQFFDYDGIFHSYDITLDQWEYESHWYFIQIVQWPIQKRFELMFIHYPEVIFKKILYIHCPYRSFNQQLTFGGGLLLNDDEFFQNIQGRKKLSFFPGKLYYDFLTLQIGTFDRNGLKIAIDTFGDLYICNCQSNINVQIENQILNWLDQKYFTSENGNCDQFGLSGWLRIKEINKLNDNFDYKFMKMNKFSQNQKLNDDNLSAFQLIYRISQQQYEILIMSYSYRFPIVNIDFNNNPFLIIKQIEINNNIYLWHYLQVTLQQNVLQIIITFYQELNKYQYQEQINVYHFNEIQFQIHYGNINQESNNYLNIQIQNFNFYNCDISQINKNCHSSCQLCDGPTNSDCLSCQNNSNRIYIPLQKACICQYNTIDQDFCYSYQHFQFQLIQYQTNQLQCQYGYFYFNSQTCIKCPSIIQSNLITCLECIENPLYWQYNPYCQTLIYIIHNNTYNTIKDQTIQYYIIIDDQLQLCEYCSFSQLQNEQALYNNYITNINRQQRFCQRNQIFYGLLVVFECYSCNLDACLECAVTETGLACILCLDNFTAKNGQCQLKVVESNYEQQLSFFVKNKCLAPYYITSNKGCKLCQIKNCRYCFEFQKNDLKKCTLYDNFEIFQEDEFHSVGCSLCEDNFIFDFTVGLCLHQKPNLQFCLRSFINLDGTEICTLSSIDDFRVASQIINCEKLIINCLQCVLISSLQIKCVICAQGYTSSVTTGSCYTTPYNNSKISIEGDRLQMNGWIQLIQSFLMSFLPNSYYYPMPFSYLITPLPIVCMDGYQITQHNTCESYCQSDCLDCEETNDINFKFQCKKCSLDYYRLPLRSKYENQCLKCSPLCAICQPRDISEINQLNKHFIITDSNLLYTYKCLYPAPDPNIIIRQPQLTPQYCFSQNCTEFFQYEFEINYKTVQQHLTTVLPEFFYENDINTNYLNQIGIRIMRIIFLYLLPLDDQQNIQDYEMIKIESKLKQKIFSLTQVRFNIRKADISNNIFNFSLIINGFDVIEIQNMIFSINKNFYFKFENDESINLNIEDTQFLGFQDNQQILSFLTFAKDFNNLRLINLNFNNLQINDSIIWDVSFSQLGGKIEISNIHFINYSNKRYYFYLMYIFMVLCFQFFN